MISKTVQRSIFRWIHLIVAIPILGCIYEPASEVEQYVDGARFLFVPIMLFTGYTMYAGMFFAILCVAAWLGAIYLGGFGPALLSQVLLLIGRRLWLLLRARRAK
ncbi:MAG: hypothetical protein GC162_16285 [Planctomycetes bacterium]|nr:hypothetical protein [Planctomycetota bacterium]